MGALVGTHTSAMMLGSMLHDLQNTLKSITDKRQYLALKTMKLSMAQASVFQQAGLAEGAQQQRAEAQANQLAAIESTLQQLDKLLEMKQKNIESQIKITETRKKTMEKMRDKNIKDGFTFNA